mgnify:CR=1 FL=1
MAYALPANVPHYLREAVHELDLIEACQQPKLVKGFNKHVLLATVLRESAGRFQRAVERQSVLSREQFFEQALSLFQQLKQGRARVMKERKQRLAEERAMAEAMINGVEMV